MKTENEDIDELIRDITRVGFMPKSEARRRILQILSTARLDERKKVVGEIRERVEGKAYIPELGSNEKWTGKPVAVVSLQSVSDILERIINEEEERKL